MSRSIRNLCIFTIFATAYGILYPAPAVAQDSTSKPLAAQRPATQTTSADAVLTNVREFFEDFVLHHKKPERDEFETQEEYEKRLPKPWDKDKVVYFAVTVTEAEKNYKYDIDTKTLTVFGGRAGSGLVDPTRVKGTPLVIQSAFEDRGEYDATNKLGATVKVKESWLLQYALYLNGADKLPADVFDSAKGQIAFSFSMDPAEAKSLSQNTVIVVGVKLKGYEQKELLVASIHEPTFSEPRDSSLVVHAIEAEIVEAGVYNRASNKFIKKVALEQR